MEDKTFKPHEPEKTIEVIITRREAVLLQRLRKYAFGKIVVHKMNGLVIRIEPQSSELIDPDQDVEL